MTASGFYDSASGVLTCEAFSFVLDHKLRQAQRTQEFLTLVVFIAERESRDLIAAADEWVVHELPRLIRYAVRNTDLLGRSADGMLSLLLTGIDLDRAAAVIERLKDHLTRYRMLPFRIGVGAACCPTHAITPDELLEQAMARRRPDELPANR
jgi:GGDEF domain-containing protein